MNIADVATINCFNRESYPVWLSKWIAKFIEPNFIPRHVMPQYFKETFNISRLI